MLDAETYFHERVQRADRTIYDAMLDNAPDVEAQPGVAVQDILRLRRGEVAASRTDKKRAEKQVAPSKATPVREQSSKFDEAMAAYRAAMEQIGAPYDEALLKAVAKGLGPAIYNSDSKLVSCSDPEELKRVKDNFLVKKLGMADSDRLMSGIHAVCAQTKGLKGRKHRAVFYYLLVKHYSMEEAIVA
ncbi:MAG: DUF2853 family protein [Bacteroidota bacterium]